MSSKEQYKDGAGNIFWNIIEPFNGGKQFQGTAQYVIMEVLVGQLIRTIMGVPRNWLQSTEVHTYSVPLIGSTIIGDVLEGPAEKGEKGNIGRSIKEGFKASPGAILAYFAQHFRANGLSIPPIMHKEFLALILGKLTSRLLKEYLNSSLPTDLQDANRVLVALMNRQREVARSKS